MTMPEAQPGQEQRMDDLVTRLRAPAYWMSGSSDGHEGENYAPLEAADRIESLLATVNELKNKA